MGGRAIEIVCGSRLLRATLAFALAAVAAAAITASVRTPAGRSAPGEAAISFRLDHFQCYRVDPGAPLGRRIVTLVDQFAKSRAVVSPMTTLCAPVRKNGGAIRNRLAHLACYPITSKPAFRSRRATITNQFEKGTALIVVRPFQLCLPSGKTILPGPSPRPVKGLDHYQCYLVKPTRALRPRRVVLVDQFGKSRPTVVRLRSLCAPTRKNAVLARNKRDHLACYELRPSEPFRVRRAAIVNQFEHNQVTVVSPQTLCLPSLKRVVNPRPDLMVTIPNTRTLVSCPTGSGSCITTRDFVVTNAGSANVTTAFDVLIQADPAQKTTITVPALAAGASLTLTASLGPDGNCYDPDCTVSVTVDSANVIVESNETNNTATRTDLG